MPLSHEESVAALRRVGAAGLLKPMPKAKPLSGREMAVRRASAVVAAAIRDSVERCEALEAAVADRAGE